MTMSSNSSYFNGEVRDGHVKYQLIAFPGIRIVMTFRRQVKLISIVLCLYL